MKFSDIVDLAKAGYKPSDIKELLSLKTPETIEVPETVEAKTETDDTPEVKPETTKDAPETTESVIDYKALYEAEKSKVEKMQAENAAKTVGTKIEKKSQFEVVSDLYGKLY